jgi:hypothetical protein
MGLGKWFFTIGMLGFSGLQVWNLAHCLNPTIPWIGSGAAFTELMTVMIGNMAMGIGLMVWSKPK